MKELTNFQRLKLNLILMEENISYGYKDFLRELKAEDNVIRKGENK